MQNESSTPTPPRTRDEIEGLAVFMHEPEADPRPPCEHWTPENIEDGVFVYWENIGASRSLKYLRDGTLTIRSVVMGYDYETTDPHPYLMCEQCSAEFDVPADLDIDWR